MIMIDNDNDNDDNNNNEEAYTTKWFTQGFSYKVKQSRSGKAEVDKRKLIYDYTELKI